MWKLSVTSLSLGSSFSLGTHSLLLLICFRAVEDYLNLDSLMKLLELWEGEQIFSKHFSDHLKQFVKPKLDIAKSKQKVPDI